MKKYETILLCEHCICAIRSHGERVFVGETTFYDDDYDEDQVCEWCEEPDETLYKCHF